jgi:hypothetical protein
MSFSARLSFSWRPEVEISSISAPARSTVAGMMERLGTMVAIGTTVVSPASRS